jgi:hypothetical protein
VGTDRRARHMGGRRIDRSGALLPLGRGVTRERRSPRSSARISASSPVARSGQMRRDRAVAAHEHRLGIAVAQ